MGAGLCAVLIAACGGSGGSKAARLPPAQRVCQRAQRAAASTLGRPPTLHILSADQTDIICRLRSGRLTVRVEAQASAQPWVEWDTAQTHFAQAFGPGTVHVRAELPQNVTGVGTQAFWVPAEGILATTNASQSSAGSYLTVNVHHGGRSAAKLAAQVGRAALAVAPSGPKPGAPPA